nr:ribonuclease H-like domain-containing protein [Tanacetum cinerariifolium]
YDGGFVSFGDGKGRIFAKGKIKTRKLDFDDVYFCKELKYNMYSVSQMCDKKNNVLFTDTECLVLSCNFKLLDESQVLLRVPRKDNIYRVDLKSVVPTGGIENQLDYKVKVIWCDNGTEFKNSVMNQFCEDKGIKKEFNIARTPQQNRVAKRRNKTLIEAARTMDNLGKFEGKANEGYFVRYSVVRSKENLVSGQDNIKKALEQEYILIPICTTDPLLSQGSKDSTVDAKKKDLEVDESEASINGRKNDQVSRSEVEGLPQQARQTKNVNSPNSFNHVSSHVYTIRSSFVNAASQIPINVAGPSGGWESDEIVKEATCRESLEEAKVLGVIKVGYERRWKCNGCLSLMMAINGYLKETIHKPLKNL